MMTVQPDEFVRDATNYMRQAHNGSFVRVAGTDGMCVVLISDIQYQMLNQALAICVDHSEWMKDG